MLQMQDTFCHNGDWYLIHCQSHKERYASQALESRLGLSSFLPEYKISSRKGIRSIPFFANYLFVQADLQHVPPSQINATPGVIRLVAFGGEPQPIPYEVIKMIYKRLDQFDQNNVSPFKPGDVVRVKQEGPLQNLEMIFVGPSTPGYRVTVLLNLLGRLKEVKLDIETLEKVSIPKNESGSAPFG